MVWLGLVFFLVMSGWFGWGGSVWFSLVVPEWFDKVGSGWFGLFGSSFLVMSG